MTELSRQKGFQEGKHYCVNAETGCWEWLGRQLRGYAHTSGVRPHRRMYLAAVGPIPAGHDLHHACRNKLCINPAHMEVLEHRGHVAGHRREDSTLTPELVVRIREEASAGVSFADLAGRYGVSARSVEDIAEGLTWQDVGGPTGRPKAYCATCGTELVGMRHKKYCGYECRKQAEYAAKRARRKAAA